MHYVMDNIADLLLNLHGWTVNIAFEVIVNNFDHKILLQLGIKNFVVEHSLACICSSGGQSNGLCDYCPKKQKKMMILKSPCYFTL